MRAAVEAGPSQYRPVLTRDHLGQVVDLSALVQIVETYGTAGTSPDALLRWYDRADNLVKEEIVAGRATAADGNALQGEAFTLMAGSRVDRTVPTSSLARQTRPSEPAARTRRRTRWGAQVSPARIAAGPVAGLPHQDSRFVLSRPRRD